MAIQNLLKTLLGQYPAILTKQAWSIGNSYIIFQTQCLICIKTYIIHFLSVTDPVISFVYSIGRGCKDDCDLITLGSYKTFDNYELNGGKDTVSHSYFKVWYWGVLSILVIRGMHNVLPYTCMGYQGSKLRPIQSPLQVKLSTWRPIKWGSNLSFCSDLYYCIWRLHFHIGDHLFFDKREKVTWNFFLILSLGFIHTVYVCAAPKGIMVFSPFGHK